MITITFKGQDRRGVARQGRTTTHDVAMFVHTLYDQGYCWLIVTEAGTTHVLGEIDKGTNGHRRWYGVAR